MSTLNQALYDRLFDAILAGTIAPGARLAETRLAELHGVSRSVVRRTLQRLSDEGVVDIRQNRGATVARVDAAAAREIMQARRVLETGVIEIVCGSLGDDVLERLRRVCADEQAAMLGGDRSRGLKLSSRFHLLLARATGNRLLERYAVNLMSRSALAVAALERSRPTHCAYREHPAILDALADGDREGATALMRSHIDHIAENLRPEEGEEVLARLFDGSE